MKQFRFVRLPRTLLVLAGILMVSSAASAQVGVATDWKSDTSPIKFTAFLDQSWVNASNPWGSDPISAEITKRTGVSAVVQVATTAKSEQLNTLIATNDLPDFITFDPNSPVAQVLVKQGFLLPLNQLAAKYAPNFKNVIPKDLDKVWSSDDGNLYFIPSYYSDVKRIASVKGALRTRGMLSLNMPMYEKLGKPAIKTLADFKAVALKAKAMFPDVPFLVYDSGAVPDSAPWNSMWSMSQLINRVYGGDNPKSVAADGTVHLNFKDASYKKAVLYINDLYRAGLINAENFTIKAEQYDQLVKNQKIFAFWGGTFDIAKFDMTEAGPYKPVPAVQEAGSKLRLSSLATGIGGGAVAITKNCKNPERAIKYLEFLMSDEGQMLTYHGIEGKDYTMVEGMPKNTPAKAEAWKDFGKMQKDLGILNYQIGWVPSNYTDMLYYYWLNQDKVAYALSSKYYDQFENDERLSELINLDAESPAKIIETKVQELWRTSMPKLYLAKTSAEFEAAYKDFLAKADTLGLAKLEAAYTVEAKKLIAKLK